MSSVPTKTVPVSDLMSDAPLALDIVAGKSGLKRTLEHPRVQKSGLALAGFLESVRPHRLQVLGRTELQYLRSLNAEQVERSLAAFFATEIAAVVVTANQEVPALVIQAAEKNSVPLLRSEQNSSKVISGLEEWLDEKLSPEETVHGVMLDVFGVGVLILGTSGIGKSECALELVMKGHRLIADDAVRMIRRHNNVFARSLELTKHHMEIRGLGVINVLDLYGAASVRDRKRVELVVEMLGGTQHEGVDRLGLDEYTAQVLGIEVAKVTIPVRPGRNVSSIVEVAARNHLLKLQGHYSARAFEERVRAELRTRNGTS